MNTFRELRPVGVPETGGRAADLSPAPEPPIYRCATHLVAWIHWGAAFVLGMLAVPMGHHAVAWFCLAPFSWHCWRTLRTFDVIVRWYVRRTL